MLASRYLLNGQAPHNEQGRARAGSDNQMSRSTGVEKDPLWHCSDQLVFRTTRKANSNTSRTNSAKQSNCKRNDWFAKTQRPKRSGSCNINKQHGSRHIPNAVSRLESEKYKKGVAPCQNPKPKPSAKIKQSAWFQKNPKSRRSKWLRKEKPKMALKDTIQFAPLYDRRRESVLLPIQNAEDPHPVLQNRTLRWRAASFGRKRTARRDEEAKGRP